MESTYQFENIDMLEHGKMVHRSYEELLNAMKTNNINYLNQWTGFKDIEQMQFLLDNQYPFWIMQHYQIYHDCGKPFCRAIDENGKQHFSNHAEISAQIYEQYFDCEIAHTLIKNDMKFHTLKGEELTAWLEENKKNPKMLCSLYLTAWAEIIANSSMFGGAESTSFKIKKKCLISAGKKLMAICK